MVIYLTDDKKENERMIPVSGRKDSDSVTIKKDKNKLAAFFDNNLFIMLAFLCSAVIMLLVYYCFDVIPFGQSTVLRMDLFHQYGPLFAEFYDRLTGLKSFFYSWNTGGGGAFLGNYFNYLSSPIGDLIALVAGHENIPEAIGTMVLVKNGLAAATLACYLKKAFGRNDFTITAFGILYAFCGFFIAYYWNVMWIDAMYLLPLIVLGIENIINRRRCRLYIGALAVSLFSSYYMSYMICIFSVLYFLVYFISKAKFKDSYDDIPQYIDDDGVVYNRKIDTIAYNKFIRSGFLFAAGSLLAVCLAAFALIPTYFCLKTCSATSDSFPAELKLYNSIFDFLANHLASVEPTIRSSGDTVLPNVYCGILTVILLPIYVMCGKISPRERAAHIVLLAVFFAGFNLNYVNFVFHAFHFPNDLPYRFSFIYSFILVIMAYNALTHIKEIPSKGVLGSGLAVILFTVLVQKLGMDNVDDATVYTSIAFAAIYTIVLILMRKKEYASSAVALLLMCCVFAEAAVADTDHFKITQQKPNFTNEYSSFRTIKNSLDKAEGTDKYRMELTDINTIMDPAWFGYNGVTVFSSMAYESSANLQDQLGMDSNYINSYIYHSQTPVYNCMMSLKYLVNNDDSDINKELFEYVSACGKYTAYRNRYYLPLCYAVNNDTVKINTSDSNPFHVQSDFWEYATGLNGVFDELAVDDYDLDNIRDEDNFKSESFSFTKENVDADASFTLTYIVPDDMNVYMYVSSNDIEKLEVSTGSGFNTTQNIDDEAYILDCGACKKDEIMTVEMKLKDGSDSGYVDCYTSGLNMEVFKKGYDILSKNVMDITEFTDTHIKGRVNIPADNMLYTSINYDEGWTVYVDGKPAEKTKIGNALIGVKMSSGNHEVEFKFTPRGLLYGAAISAAALIFAAVYLIISGIKKRKKAAPKPLSKPADQPKYGEETDDSPKGIDAMMAEDLGEDATVEQAEALLEERDEFEGKKVDAATTINRADELLKTQKLDVKAILSEAEKMSDSDGAEDKNGQ